MPGAAIDFASCKPAELLIAELLTLSPLKLEACHRRAAADQIASLCVIALEHGGWPISDMESGEVIGFRRASAGFEVQP